MRRRGVASTNKRMTTMISIQTNEIASDVKVLSDDELNEVAAGGVSALGIAFGSISHFLSIQHSREYLAAVAVARWFSQNR
jgi:hypothetical protein